MEIVVPVFDADHSPWKTTRGQHDIHQETGHPPIAVRIGMDIAEHPVPKDCADGWFFFRFEQVEEGWHRISNRLPAGRYVA